MVTVNKQTSQGAQPAQAGAPMTRAANQYNATRSTRNRKSATPKSQAEDWILDKLGRLKLTENGRDLRRNYSSVAWALNKHLDYNTTLRHQSTNGDDGLDTDIEAYITEQSQPENFDIAGRHSLDDMLRLTEGHAVIDGDCHWLKLHDGKIQGIEGERIINPTGYTGELPYGYTPADFTHGIACDTGGRAMDYAVHSRTKTGYKFHRLYPARQIITRGYYDRIDQIRGITPLSSALNDFRDLMEGQVYALSSAKIAQFFGLVLYRDAVSGVNGTAIAKEAEPDEPRDYKNEIDLNAGPQVMDLKAGDKAEYLKSATPSVEFQKWYITILAAALKSLGIPFSFWDESFTNFYGSRAALIQYIYSASIRRKPIIRLLDHWTRWKLSIAVANNIIRLPRGMFVSDLKFQWVHAGMPWWKPKDEIAANAMAIERGFASTEDVCRESGEDAYEIAEKEARYQIFMADVKKRVREAGGRMPGDIATTTDTTAPTGVTNAATNYVVDYAAHVMPPLEHRPPPGDDVRRRGGVIFFDGPCPKHHEILHTQRRHRPRAPKDFDHSPGFTDALVIMPLADFPGVALGPLKHQPTIHKLVHCHAVGVRRRLHARVEVVALGEKILQRSVWVRPRAKIPDFVPDFLGPLTA
jgi:capsid protein